MFYTLIKNNIIICKEHTTPDIVSGISLIADGVFVLDLGFFYHFGKDGPETGYPLLRKYSLRDGSLVPACETCRFRLKKITSDTCESSCHFQSKSKIFPKSKIIKFLISNGFTELTPIKFYKNEYPSGGNYRQLLDRRKMKNVEFSEDSFSFPLWRFYKTETFRESTIVTAKFKTFENDPNHILVSNSFITSPNISNNYWTFKPAQKVDGCIKRVLSRWGYEGGSLNPEMPYTFYSGYQNSLLRTTTITNTVNEHDLIRSSKGTLGEFIRYKNMLFGYQANDELYYNCGLSVFQTKPKVELISE